MRDIALTAAFFIILPFVLRRPWLGIAILACLGYMNPQRLCYGFAFTFPFYKITVFVTIAAAFLSRQPRKLPWTLETWLLLAFAFWTSFTTLFAISPVASYEYDKSIKIQISIFMTLMLIRTPAELRWLLWTIALSLGFYGFKGGAFTILTGGGNRVIGPENSFISDNNALALALTMTIPLMRFLQLTTEIRWVRLALGGGMALTAAAILGTYSRGGVIALGVTGALLAMMSRRRLLFATLGLMVIVAVVSFMPVEWTDRMKTIQTYEDDESVRGRFLAWEYALTVTKDRPLIGAGFMAFTDVVYERYAPTMRARDAHSIYFKILAEQGIPGFLLFIAIGVVGFMSASRIKRATRARSDLSWANDLATMCQISIVAYAVGGAFLGMCYFDLPYHIVTFIVLTKVFVNRHLAVASEEAAPVETADEWQGPASVAPARA